MVKISDRVFSQVCKEYSTLWTNNRGSTSCTVLCKKLADRLTEEIRDLVTTQDVVRKVYAVRYNLRRLHRKRGVKTRITDYKWLTPGVGLAWALKTLTRTIRDREQREEVVEQVQAVQMTDDESRAPCASRLANKYLVSPDLFAGDKDSSYQSTSAYASLRNQLKRVEAENDELKRRLATFERVQAEIEDLKRRLARSEGREVQPEANNVVLDVQTLRDAVNKLSPLQKIVQLHFNEAFTNGKVVYSRADDSLSCCGYADEQKKYTAVYNTVMVFPVRSLPTSFNIVLSYHPQTKSNVTSKDVMDNLKLAKELGFNVLAVVRDRNLLYKKALKELPAGVLLIHDNLYKSVESTTKFWAERGADLTVSSPRNNNETIQFFNEAMPIVLRAAINENLFLQDPEMAKRIFRHI
uniref:Uncharacterized protein n=1 Tax=Glossina palpalis gambiensis TaxID=67801 RepID=A0A1B0BEC7_9MUSC